MENWTPLPHTYFRVCIWYTLSLQQTLLWSVFFRVTEGQEQLPRLSCSPQLPISKPVSEPQAKGNIIQVRNFDINLLIPLARNFIGGTIANHFTEWQQLTSDEEILQIVLGDTIDFDGEVPSQHAVQNCKLSADAELLVENEILDLLKMKVVVPSSFEESQFLSPIFPVHKHDGGIRIILNLKELNNYVKFYHFKMDTIKSVLLNITKGCYMVSLDLTHAYHSVRIDKNFQKYLKFMRHGNLYQYTCYPNGLSSCPRRFTKLMKVPLSHLRMDNCFIIGYIDDFFLQGITFDVCMEAMCKAINLFINLGLTINPSKSQFGPSTTITFLGFVIDSIHMKVTLTAAKKQDLHELLALILHKPQHTIRLISRIVGKLVASLPASLYGPLYYRNIERDKNKALSLHKGDFDVFIFCS
jgi:hypothetical protein